MGRTSGNMWRRMRLFITSRPQEERKGLVIVRS
jgi:hypothetical protein